MSVGLVPYVVVLVAYILADRLAFRVSGAPTSRDRTEWTFFAVAVPYVLCLVLPGVQILLGTAYQTAAGMIVGGILVAAAIWIRWAGVTTLGRHFSAAVETHEGHELIDTGVFARVRHPLYAGICLLYVGLALFGGATWAWLAVVAAVVGVAFRVRAEERWLLEHLPSYADYMRRTKRFIPGVW